MKNLRCFVILLCAFVAAPLYANDVTLFGGLQREGKITLRSAVQSGTSASTYNPKNFGTFGIRVAHGKVIGGEHTLAYSPNFVESQTKAVIYNSNLLVEAPLPKIHPYITAGLGGIFTSSSNSLLDIGKKFAVNYGGGLKIFPAGPAGIRIDARGYTIPSIQDQTLNVIEVSVGVVFAF